MRLQNARHVYAKTQFVQLSVATTLIRKMLMDITMFV